MIKYLFAFIFSLSTFFAFAQIDTTLKTYYVSAKVDEDCQANIVITFFN